MSQEAFEEGPVKTTNSMSRSGRITTLLGILGAMVRGGRGKGVRGAGLRGGVAVPRGVRVPTSQRIPSAGSALWLIR